ncbi:MAG: XkdF-like putative serine protease domain-containing protein [Bacteroidota bacterium]
MPYSNPKEVPSSVPSGKKRQFMEVFNSVYSDTKDEGKAMAAAYSAIKKAQYANDIFTTAEEARSRSMDMGLNGDIHVSDYNEQAVYMPASSEDAYIAYYEQLGGIEGGQEPEDQEDAPMDRIEALRAIVAEVIGKKMTKTNIEGKILKTDDEQRMVFGWASVVTEDGEPVVDRQGDVIEAETLVKAVNEFMEHVRVGKAMHVGEQVGVVVHSLPITKEIGEALGIQSNREGWVVAYKVFDDDVWAMVKSGELAAFSIGGRAMKEEI